MNETDLRNLTRQFIQNEGQKATSVMSYIQALEETLSLFTPKTQSDRRRLEVSKSHLREIRRLQKKLEEENNKLKEELSLLQEKKIDEEIEKDYS